MNKEKVDGIIIIDNLNINIVNDNYNIIIADASYDSFILQTKLSQLKFW